MLLKLVWKNIVTKKLNSALSIILMTLGVALISFIKLGQSQIEESFTKNLKNIDMVIGAKGSPLQLILASVFQMDSPTGNINYDSVLVLKQNMFIKEFIPLSLGDNFEGNRIIGTNDEYFKHFDCKLDQGRWFNKEFEVVVGSQVHLNINDKFVSAHGLDKDGDDHQEQHFVVVGKLAPNTTVNNRLIMCSLASFWQLHHVQNKDITSVLVKFRSTMGMLSLPKLINQNTPWQAALPSIEISRLFKLLGVGVEALQFMAFIIIFVSFASVFISLYNALKERKYEIALMLSMGASRLKLFAMLVFEGMFIAFIGYILGIALARMAVLLFCKYSLKQDFDFWMNPSQEEIFIGIAALVIGFIAAALPSINVYKINISKTLSEQ